MNELSQKSMDSLLEGIGQHAIKWKENDDSAAYSQALQCMYEVKRRVKKLEDEVEELQSKKVWQR